METRLYPGDYRGPQVSFGFCWPADGLNRAAQIPDLRDREVPREVAIFDDLLTTGCHFKAMQSIIHDHWPTVLVSGIFIARRYITNREDGE